MAQTMATTYEGLTQIKNLTAEQRIYGRTADILKLTHGNKANMRIMYTNFKSKGGTAITTDMEFKYKCDIPRPTLIPNATNSGGSTSENIIYVAEKYAPYVEVGMNLIVRGLYTYNSGTYTAWTTTRGTSSATSEEIIKVLAKGVSDGTNVPITVQRNVKPPHGGTTPADITSAGGNIATTNAFVLMPKVQAIGSNEAGLYSDVPYEETNYCEINFGKWGIPSTMENIKILQDESLSAREGRKKLELFWDTLEWRQIFQVKDTGYDAQNRQWYTTGGLNEYIETSQSSIGYTSTNNIINFQSTYGNVNYQNINKMMGTLFYWGSNEKFWVMDESQHTAVTNSFDNKIRIVYNQALSDRYGFVINTLTGGGGKLHIIQSDAFSMNGFTDLSYIVDYNFFKHCHLQNEDFTIMKGVNEGNPLIKMNYIYMNSGIIRRNPFAHFKVYNMVS